MKLAKNDFIEIQFTGKTKDGTVFDTNISEELKKLNPKAKAKPFIFCLGQDMFLKGAEEFVLGKELGNYTIELTPDKAFGKRDPTLIKRMPLAVFHKQKLNPIPGATFNFDGKIGKVLAASGGRVIVDFNNPLAGKDVVYELNILRKVDDMNEKIKAVNDFLFRKELPYELKEKTLKLYLDKQMSQFAILFKDKYKDMLGLELEVEEKNK